MSYRIALAFIAAALAASATARPTAAQTTQSSASAQQCRWEAPPQFGPRALVQPPRWICTPARAEERRGHYEYCWPIWASQRALPLVRIWDPDPPIVGGQPRGARRASWHFLRSNSCSTGRAGQANERAIKLVASRGCSGWIW
jgi:hypothetical protein